MSSLTTPSQNHRPQRGLFLAPFDELSDPLVLIDLAIQAEAAGWDGVFLWDHIAYRPPVRAVLDPWVMLGAIAARTERLRLGPMVTPLSRRRVQKVARETVTLDRLSGGRLILGVGLGANNPAELEAFGEVVDPRERARLLDEGLARLSSLWGGEFMPPPVRQRAHPNEASASIGSTPYIPVWVAARWPNRRPVARALAWDGIFPIELPDPEALAQLAAEIAAARGPGRGRFDLVVEIEPGDDPQPWAAAGATWVLTGFGRQPRVEQVREAIAAGTSSS